MLDIFRFIAEFDLMQTYGCMVYLSIFGSNTNKPKNSSDYLLFFRILVFGILACQQTMTNDNLHVMVRVEFCSSSFVLHIFYNSIRFIFSKRIGLLCVQYCEIDPFKVFECLSSLCESEFERRSSFKSNSVGSTFAMNIVCQFSLLQYIFDTTWCCSELCCYFSFI